MKAADFAHVVQPEEVMAYLDGELEPHRASAVRAHLTNCDTCQAVAADVRRVSHSLAAWQVDGPTTQLAPAGPVVTQTKSVLTVTGSFVSAHMPLAAAAVFFVVIGGLWLTNGLR